MINFLNTISLGLFFLYFVLISGSCGEILNCGLQRFVQNSIWFKHVMILLSIYIFTFILNWYTIDSIVVENYDNKENEEEKGNDEENKTGVNPRLRYLYESFLYSILIYIIFVISTKTEGKYLAIFLLLSVLLVIIQIILKALYGSYTELNLTNLFKSVNDIKNQDINMEKFDDNLILILKFLPFIYLITFMVLMTGLGKYYTRQRKDHTKNWDMIKFIFGNNKCNL
ncbi:hypothetical protein PGAG_00315 [Phaeocystis globosa virus 12T]|uniref:Uncharacterized protein n=1 Tax=Phaeocystis globosa virus PgV-16T TaxID=3071227 RepID=A0AC59EXJ9_9VIRU|nr:hypothetical protein PGCG_00354 [Phaeocystis globosa virus]AET73204.1 hypothetical protein PGAG_00315 [Phaeocystis globosa virus 12T]AET74028.1 hypothetical protein PGBG_00320 [Phaeocystis globosa virus 14T]AGM15665.1 hypothetical protein PGCG_00354 [Phaeocystis globosa virus PgV-16T]UYE94395.1 DUF3169 family protein [Phaeocystis globosa virus]